ncbi:hypothetical protein AX16_003049 [Volvariella volvacea WC 439]|nr:hypothetical protein AX16_003049 [Volvariella volvacea WC 439]
MSSYLSSLAIASLMVAAHAAPVILTPTNPHQSRAPGDQDVGGCTRSTLNILWSCLLTMVACTYSSVHPDVPNPGSTALKEHIILAIHAFISPEAVIIWAARQNKAAYEIKEELLTAFKERASQERPPVMNNKDVDQTGDGQPTIMNDENFDNTRNREQPPMTNNIIADQTSKNEQQGKDPEAEKFDDWTLTHSFFLQMGGFMIKEDDQTYRVLKADKLKEPSFKFSVTEQEIRERSKVDWFGKFITIMQTWWFVAQCCARFAQGLDISVLEVITLAFAVLNVLSWIMWWKKPFCVHSPIYFDKTGNQIPGPDFERMRHWMKKERRGCCQWSFFGFKLPCMQYRKPEREAVKGYESRQENQLDWDTYFMPSIQEKEVKVELRDNKVKYYYMDSVGQFHVSQTERSNWRTWPLWLFAISIAFGAAPSITWTATFHFPTQTERLIWEVASSVGVGIPAVLFTLFALYRLSHFLNPEISQLRSPYLSFFMWVMYTLSVKTYILARLILLGLAMSSLRELTPSTHQVVRWTGFLPHI